MIGQRAELVASRQPGADEMAAYERVLSDALAGDATLFARMDYVEEAWRIVDPLKITPPFADPHPGTGAPPPRADAPPPPGGGPPPTQKKDQRLAGAAPKGRRHPRPPPPPRPRRGRDTREDRGGGSVSERQWGTVREDYSHDGRRLGYFPTTRRGRAPTAGARTASPGICDERQRLCFALALWNGRDPILKERLFGLTNGEGNHGEDVKEYYFYLDCTPTHSYLKCALQVSPAGVPLRRTSSTTNARRGKQDLEYELLDTGVFDDDRYFDVVVEYAKARPTTS